MKTFNVGDRVGIVYNGKVARSDPDYDEFGSVSADLGDGNYAVLLDGNEFSNEHSTEELMLESDIKEKQTELEADFAKLTGKLGDKAKTAADALREFSKAANEAGLNLVTEDGYLNYEIYDLVQPIMRAIDSCGWSSSSLTC